MKYFSYPSDEGHRLQMERDTILGSSLRKIYWISRHELTQEQRKALLLLHGDNLLVEQRDLYFFNEEEFLNLLGTLIDGFVYVVAKRSYIETATNKGYHFGEFRGHNDTLFGFEFKCVYHYKNGYRYWQTGAKEVANSKLVELSYSSVPIII